MERDELADDRIAFMAGEVGCVVFELIYNGIEINKDNIVGFWKENVGLSVTLSTKGCCGMRLKWYGRVNDGDKLHWRFNLADGIFHTVTQLPTSVT
jgi:hypothetical protein